MVEQITAYRTEDGQLHESKHEAIVAETRDRLFKFLKDNGCNDGQANSLSKQLEEFRTILEPLVEYHFQNEGRLS